jgi:nucleotide-binding universal stress UspA family protein
MTESTEPGSNATVTHIVVGVDGSPESLYALDLAAAIGRPQRAELVIVHVRPTPTGFGFGPAGSIEYVQAEDELDALVTNEAATRLTGYAGRWTVTIRSGNVGRELLAVADEAGADLVVLGHVSHGTVHDTLLGSVASNVVHRSRRSVLVAIPPA